MEKQENRSIFVAILAGGKSTRMGTDKASLLQEGETLLTRTVRLVQRVSDLPPLVVGRDEPAGWNGPATVFVSDDTPGIGPVGGLRTALRIAKDHPVLALSCDLPALTDVALEWLLRQQRGECGVVARNGEQWEPLFAIYSPACLPLVETNIDAGKRSLHALIHAAGDKITVADVPAELVSALRNVNTPEQWLAFLNP